MPPPPFNPKPSEDVCEAQERLAAKLGTNRVLMGIMTEGGAHNYENAIRGVPYGLKYLYLASRALEPGDFSNCTASCDNCPRRQDASWWGCWNHQPGERPGRHLRNLLQSSEAAGQIPMVVYYTVFRTIAEGAGHLPGGLLNDSNVRDYLRDWRFTLGVVNDYQQQSGKPVMIHIEPDLWGFAQQGGPGRRSPRDLPTNVQWAAEPDCPEQENNFAGFGECMVRMARRYAPQATIGLMASGWATGMGDINLSTDPRLDVEGIARSTGEYMNELGANLADFLVVEFSDRDAGYYAAQGQSTRWYDPNNRTFPNFHRTFLWGKTLADTVKLPLVWWQIPMGHMGLGNRDDGRCTGAWQDNRVDYLLEHLDEVAATQAVALAFGPGACNQTSPETDGGNLANRVRTYAATSGQPWVCQR